MKIRQNSALISNAHVMKIGGLAVDPSVQHQGLGAALVTKAIEEAATREAQLLKLHVLGTNLVAMRLYEGCGFEVEGVLREEFFLSGGFVDDVIMSKKLSAPD